MQKPRRCNNIWSDAWFTSQLIQCNIYLTIFTVVHSLNQAYLLMAFKVTVQLLKFLKRKELFLSESNSHLMAATSSFGSLSTLPVHLLTNWGCVPLGWSGSGSVIRDHSDHIWTDESLPRMDSSVHLHGCVPLGWSGSGSLIIDHSDHCRSNEPMNPCSE